MDQGSLGTTLVAKPTQVSSIAIAHFMMLAPGDEPLGLLIDGVDGHPLGHEHHAIAIDVGEQMQVFEDFGCVGGGVDHKLQLVGSQRHELLDDMGLMARRFVALVPAVGCIGLGSAGG